MKEKKMEKIMESEYNIGKLVVSNRIVMTALGLELGKDGGGVSDRLLDFYRARAKGGVGLIITGITRVKDGAGAGERRQLAARNWKDIEGLRKLAKAVHEYDTKIFLQLHHPGNQITSMMNAVPEAPSPICGTDEKMIPHELTTWECEEIVKCFVRGARVAQIAGIDGVELHAAHFYLLNEFLSRHYNKRTDKYGGSLENRARMIVEILHGIKKSCGDDYPVVIRMMADEFLKDGNGVEEGIAIAKHLEREGADGIDLSCGGVLCIEPHRFPQGSKKKLVEPVKQAVRIPVIAVNNVKEPLVAENLLQEGVSDFVGLGRALIADPCWYVKAVAGREADIVKCCSCYRCFFEISKMKEAVCSVNKDICADG